MGLFGKGHHKDPTEQVKEWSKGLRQESRKLERQVNAIKREEQKVTMSLKASAKAGQVDVCRIYAKELHQSRKARNKILTAKAQLSSVEMQMKNQMAVAKIAGCLEKSTQVMQGMQKLIKLPEIQATMMEMSKEMMKAGIMEEMMEDTMESVLEDEDLEDAADEEVDKILYELTAGALGQAGDVASGELPMGATAAAESDEEDEKDDEMAQRLAALKST